MSFIIQEMLSSVRLRFSNKFQHVKLQSLPCSTNVAKIQPNQKIQSSTKTLNNKQLFGQPTHSTHPHRLLEGEVVPGIRKEELRARRYRLLHYIETDTHKRNLNIKSHVVVIPSSHKKFMSEKIPYVFRQNTDFLYLTGCMEQDSVLVLTAHGDSNYESILFLKERNANEEIFDGPRTCPDQAVELFGVEKSLPISHLEGFLYSFVKENQDCGLWYDFMNKTPAHPDIHKKMNTFFSQIWNKIWTSPRAMMHFLRLYKSPAEQELMRKTCAIASKAFKATIKNSKPNDNEAEIWARVDFECRMNGAEYLAYPPVVAGGSRANYVHYINNDQIVKDGEMVLMDAGCEYHSYTSDVTRVWPINGKFTPAQRELYEVIYSVQTELLRMCHSFPSFDDLYKAMLKLLGERLKDAGVFSNKVDVLSDLSQVARMFCPHDVGHYLGMDLHDTSTVPKSIKLEPGMVFTIEPGVYISSNNKEANPKFYGLGIRIEDDVLMTNNGPEILTLSCPKHPDDIEKLMSNDR